MVPAVNQSDRSFPMMSADKVCTCWKSADKKSRPTLSDDRFLSDNIVGCQKLAAVCEFFSIVCHRLKTVPYSRRLVWRDGIVTSTRLSCVEPVSTGIGLYRSTISVYIQSTLAHSAWPSLHGRCSKYWRRFIHRWGRSGVFCIAVGPVMRTAGMVA